jgi:hypothetical protein
MLGPFANFVLKHRGVGGQVEQILDSGVSCNLRDGYGNTLLMVAAQNGNKRIAKMCLRRGGAVNAQVGVYACTG